MKKIILVLLSIITLTIGYSQNNDIYKIKKSKGKYGVINKKSKEIIIPFIYDNIIDFDGNYATVKYLLKTEILNFDPCKSIILEYYKFGKININNEMEISSNLLVIINPKNKFSRFWSVRPNPYYNNSPHQREIDHYSKEKRKSEIDKCQFEREKHINKITKQYSKLGWKIEYQNEK